MNLAYALDIGEEIEIWEGEGVNREMGAAAKVVKPFETLSSNWWSFTRFNPKPTKFNSLLV